MSNGGTTVALGTVEGSRWGARTGTNPPCKGGFIGEEDDRYGRDVGCWTLALTFSIDIGRILGLFYKHSNLNMNFCALI